MKYLYQFVLFLVAVAILCGLQYRYWLGEGGHHDYLELQKELELNQTIVSNQIATNNTLKADVKDLKTGLEAVEEHARLDLGLIKSGETFVQMSTASKINKRKLKKGTKRTIEAIPEPLVGN